MKYRQASNPHVIPNHPFRLMLVGPSQSGKTYQATEMLTDKRFYKRFFDNIFIFTTTPHQDYYEKIKKANNGRDQHVDILPLEADEIAKVISILEEARSEITDENEMDLNTTLIMVDDPSRKQLGFKEFEKLFKSGRHLGASVMVLSQAFKDVPDMCRTCITHYMLFNQSKENLEKFWSAHGVLNIYPREFNAFAMEVFAKQYNFIYYDATKPPLDGRYNCGFEYSCNWEAIRAKTVKSHPHRAASRGR